MSEARGSRTKSKNDTWSEKELSKYISKGPAAEKLNKTSPEVYRWVHALRAHELQGVVLHVSVQRLGHYQDS